MWSLLEKKGESLLELKPKVFSNGKSQEDIVNEVVSEIKKGRKIIFIHGVCGSGKSAIALNIAKELGRTSIVVPIKNLQRQYQEDYMNKKVVLNKKGENLNIAMIMGRQNFLCPYLEENKREVLQTRIKEKNSNLYDIFSEFKQVKLEDDNSCNNQLLPCKIEIKQKNLATLKKYYTENPDRKDNSDLNLKVAKRLAIAPACPYYSPLLNSDMNVKLQAERKEYASISGKHSIYIRKSGCPYYTQFKAYSDADVIIFNGDQYLLETGIGRKPATEIEIIDECDEFLDNFALEGNINLSRLTNELIRSIVDDSQKRIVDSLIEEIEEIISETKKYSAEEIILLKDCKLKELIKTLFKSDMFDIAGEDSYIEHCVEIAEKFYELIDESYVSFSKDKKSEIYAKLVTIHLDKMLNSLIEKNKAMIFMSGTLHSEKVLKEIFGIKDFKIINAETFNQGTITKLRSGLEKDFSFDNLNKGRATREEYLKALDKCVQISKIPTIVQVNAFQDLPNQSEIDSLKLKNLIPTEELVEQQKNDKEGKIIREFKEGKSKILFTTRCNRGIDFPFETCNSVVITKFPYPNTQSLFWRILKKNKPQFFWDFYKDKAHRELLQRVYRSVRAADDHVFLLSPDSRVLDSEVV